MADRPSPPLEGATPLANPYEAPKAEALLPPEAPLGPGDALDATLGRRFGAYMLDQFAMVVVAIVALVGVDLAFGAGSIDAVPDQIFGLLIAAVSTFVYGGMEGSAWHASLGKKLLGLEVVTLEGEYLTTTQALQRNAAKWIGLSVCGLLAFSVFFGGDERGWWDKAAKTRTIRKNPYAD